MKVEAMKKVWVPERVAGRHTAQGIVAGCVGTEAVEVDFSKNELLTPSFVDELLRALVVDQHVTSVRVSGLSDRGRELVLRSIRTRQLENQIKVA